MCIVRAECCSFFEEMKVILIICYIRIGMLDFFLLDLRKSTSVMYGFDFNN